MNKTKKVQRKLAQYSGVAASILAAGPLQAQILYTDVSPDVVLSGNDTLGVDMDQNGVNDFMAVTVDSNQTKVAGFGYYYNPAGASYPSQQVLGSLYTNSGGSSSNFVSKLDANALVDANGGFIQGGFLAGMLNGVVLNGAQWDGVTDKFVGVRFYKFSTNSFHYGWVRMDVSNGGTSIIVKDYALNATAANSILAGQNTIGLLEEMKSKFNVVVLPSSIEVTTSEDFGSFSIRLTDLSGKLITEVPGIAGRNNEVSTAHVGTGIYMLSIAREDIVYSQKYLLNPL